MTVREAGTDFPAPVGRKPEPPRPSSTQRTIYVVQGSTGEYSDHREWPVRAFASEAQAQKFVVVCTRRAKEIAVKYPDRWDEPEGVQLHELDPGYDRSYTGTNYNYFSVELDETP